ncbi:hypothetical protein OROHE_019025 [Orobanche hederae]
MNQLISLNFKVDHSIRESRARFDKIDAALQESSHEFRCKIDSIIKFLARKQERKMQNIVANANASAKEYYVQRSSAADNPSRKCKSTCSDDDLTALRLGKSEYVPPPLPPRSNTESVGDANKIRRIITFRLETMKQAAYVALSNILNQNYKLSVTAEDVKNHLESIEKIRSRNLRGPQGISLNPPSQAGINRSISTVWDEKCLTP